MKKTFFIFIVLFIFLSSISVFADDTKSFASFRGANYNEQDYGFGKIEPNDLVDAEIAGAAAEKLNLNIIRITAWVKSHPNHVVSDDDFLKYLTGVVDIFAKHNLKVIILFGGYAGYDVDCYNVDSFLDVQDRAKKIVFALKDHPALYAWELQNEVPNGNSECAAANITKAVNAMYDLVKSIDPNTPTTVSEAFGWQNLKRWNQISTFSSFHWYPSYNNPLSSPITTTMLTQIQNEFSDALEKAKADVAPMPLIMGEFGVSAQYLTEEDQAKIYQVMFNVLKSQNVGGLLWDLAPNDGSIHYSIIKPDGQFKQAAEVVRAEYFLGDLNNNSKVDIFDYNILVSNFGNPYTIFDYNTLISNFGKSL